MCSNRSHFDRVQVVAAMPSNSLVQGKNVNAAEQTSTDRCTMPPPARMGTQPLTLEEALCTRSVCLRNVCVTAMLTWRSRVPCAQAVQVKVCEQVTVSVRNNGMHARSQRVHGLLLHNTTHKCTCVHECSSVAWMHVRVSTPVPCIMSEPGGGGGG